MCLLISRSAISTMGHIKHPLVLSHAQFTSQPPLCLPPLAGSLPTHLPNLFLPSTPAIRIQLLFSLPQQTNRSGQLRTSPTRPGSNPNTPTQIIGNRIRSNCKPPGWLRAPNQGPRVQCSDDSAVTTPVSAVSQLPPQPLIRGVDYGVPGSVEHGLHSAFFIFQSNNGHKALPASYPESIANMAQGKLPIDYHQPQLGSLDDSYSLHRQIPTKTEVDGDCSFAKTSPQFISPFSDSAVTSQPQLLPLYAPKPVRQIPKVCFTPPEDDPLPPSSLLYQPASRAVRETTFPAPQRRL